MLSVLSHHLLFGLTAFGALIPATWHALRERPAQQSAGRGFWWLAVLAFAAAFAWTVAQYSMGWRTGFGPTLWLIIAVTLALYGVLAALDSAARRLAGLLMSYLCLLAFLAVLWGGAPERPLVAPVGAWMVIHIVAAVLAYGLATLAAVAGLGVLLQEAALKRKSRPAASFPGGLPAVAEGEALQRMLLGMTAIVLALGLASGMAEQYVATGGLLPITHKVLLATISFVGVLVLLGLQSRASLAGRRLARLLLAAYLALALAYPGVKFVTDVLLSGN